MAYQELLQEDHKYLSKEYCTGYTDDYGKWNTGFYCPQYGSKTAVFCCGTTTFKYCCTNKEPVDLSVSGPILLDGDDPNFDGGGIPHHGVSSAVFVRVPVVFGVVCGIAAVLILFIVAGCYFCSCCFAYKKRRNDLLQADPRHHHLHLNHHPNHHAGLYRSTTGTNSTASSNVLNLYSPATTGPLVTTPLDLDWASSLASTYQSQQQLYNPSLAQTQLPGIHHPITPSAFAAALHNQRPTSSPASSLLFNTTSTSGIGSSLSGGTSSGAPSVISASLTNSRLPYQNFLNTSTSTLSSTSGPIRQNNPSGAVAGAQQQQLHRGNLPQQISTTASIVNSYLASLQQVQSQIQSQATPSMPIPTETSSVPVQVPVPQPPPPIPTIPPERTRHPSPPPSYFQSVSSSNSYSGSGNGGSNRNSRSNPNNSGTRSGSGSGNRMATIQSILGGSNYYSTGNFNWSNEDDLLLADFLLRHENTLRRTLGLSSSNNRNNNSNNNNNQNQSSNNTNTNNSRNRGNPLLSQRELIDLLLRLTCNTANPSTTSTANNSSSRSESRAGSETNSTASSVATTRSTVSSSSSTSNASIHQNHHHHHQHHHSKIPSNNSKLTINEVDEDLDEMVSSSTGTSGTGTTSTTSITLAPGLNMNSKSSLDLTLSRLSVENDSGVASSGCSTAGSEHAEGLIGSIKAISRDISEEALRLKKQHAVDDDDDDNPKMCEQQLAATIHPEVNCCSGDGGLAELNKSKSTSNSGVEEKEISDVHVHHPILSTATTPPAPKEYSDPDAPTVIVHGISVTVSTATANSVLPVHVVKAGESNTTATATPAQAQV